MSGPKVVKIVTREEVIATCQALLSRVEQAIEHWIQVVQRNECATEDEIEAARARYKKLVNALERDRFMDIQKQVPSEEAFLQSDLERRLALVAAKVAAERSRARHRVAAASMLLKELAKPLDAALEEGLKHADESAVNQGFAMLASSVVDQAGSEQAEATQAQASRLRDDRPVASFEGWRQSDPDLERIEARLFTLSQLEGHPDLGPFEERLRMATYETDQARRDLLIDSLEVELGRATTQARAGARLREERDLLLAELRAIGVSTESFLAEPIEKAIAEATKTLEIHRASHAAAARRAAVLEGLASLGYEVTEGMSTAWVDQGRVVLRKAAQPDYGVELSGNGEAGRLQMRAVAFTHNAAGPDPGRDADAEQIWCGDVAGLAARLDEKGAQLAIERALPVGATPLKRIELSEDQASHIAREGPVQQTRQLP